MGSDRPGIEIIRPARGRRFTCALLDFDGTLSLIRQGWQDVMIPMMLEVLEGLDHGRSWPELERLAREDVAVLTGRQTIYQMIRLAERVRQFGGVPADPLTYKREYNRRLMARIAGRRQRLASGACASDELLLRGARAFLEALRERGLKLYLTSGTDEGYVIEEAGLVGITGYFEGGIYGAREDYRTYSKAKVIERMLRENTLPGAELLGVGDGFVEISETRSAGGYAVGVASDEARGGGAADSWKRKRLIEAGADMIIADFSDLEGILAALFGTETPQP